MAKKKTFACDAQIEGTILFEQDIKVSHHNGVIGIKVSEDGKRAWVCLDGKALIRVSPDIANFNASFAKAVGEDMDIRMGRKR